MTHMIVANNVAPGSMLLGAWEQKWEHTGNEILRLVDYKCRSRKFFIFAIPISIVGNQ